MKNSEMIGDLGGGGALAGRGNGGGGENGFLKLQAPLVFVMKRTKLKF